MLWASDALNEAGRPAVLLLGASLVGGSVRACNAYVDRALETDEVLPGTFYVDEDTSVPVNVQVVGEWAEPTAFTLAHPIPETPDEVLELTEVGWRIVFPTVKGTHTP